MVWTTKSTGTGLKYVLLRHKLKDLNGFINGIKFRGGYAAVLKNTKVYHALKKLPLVSEELPLVHLRNLVFITRTSDVGVVYGKDVYSQYIQELTVELAKQETTRVEIDEAEHIKKGGCNFRVAVGTLCKHEAMDISPSKYCKAHLLKDPRLKEFGIEFPRLSRDEKKVWKKKIIKELSKLKKKGEF